jgi:hypothetical protein
LFPLTDKTRSLAASDGNFTHGAGYLVNKVISDPTFVGVIFICTSDPHRLHFSPMVRLVDVRNFRFLLFRPANPPKFSSTLKFWLSLIISLTQILYYYPWCLSYSQTLFFFWCSNPTQLRGRIHLHFAKPTGAPKPSGYDFSPTGVATGRFRRVPRVRLRVSFCQTRLESVPLPSLQLHYVLFSKARQ